MVIAFVDVSMAATARASGDHTMARVPSSAIADGPRGTSGFGYDPVFVPEEGDGRTFAEMSPAEKHAISHRGRALAALLEQLRGAG